jgi:hypothetical protein
MKMVYVMVVIGFRKFGGRPYLRDLLGSAR